MCGHLLFNRCPCRDRQRVFECRPHNSVSQCVWPHVVVTDVINRVWHEEVSLCKHTVTVTWRWCVGFTAELLKNEDVCEATVPVACVTQKMQKILLLSELVYTFFSLVSITCTMARLLFLGHVCLNWTLWQWRGRQEMRMRYDLQQRSPAGTISRISLMHRVSIWKSNWK